VRRKFVFADELVKDPVNEIRGRTSIHLSVLFNGIPEKNRAEEIRISPINATAICHLKLVKTLLHEQCPYCVLIDGHIVTSEYRRSNLTQAVGLFGSYF
jgi:hypothetical protein